MEIKEAKKHILLLIKHLHKNEKGKNLKFLKLGFCLSQSKTTLSHYLKEAIFIICSSKSSLYKDLFFILER